MNIEFKKTTLDDLTRVMEIYKKARIFMKENHNPNQWQDLYPTKESVKKDILNGISYLVSNENKEILGVYSLLPYHDPSYDVIYEGKWMSDQPYHTIHKIASTFIQKDFVSLVVNQVKTLGFNIRIDTHEDNIIMQKQILKNGFCYCGKIKIERGEERLAYELIIK